MRIGGDHDAEETSALLVAFWGKKLVEHILKYSL